MEEGEGAGAGQNGRTDLAKSKSLRFTSFVPCAGMVSCVEGFV